MVHTTERLHEKNEIYIAGAGPAGITAAINLKAAGYNVVVYEMRKTVGARLHGDYQGIENWSSSVNAMDQLSQMGIDTSTFDHHGIKYLLTTNGLGESRESSYSDDSPLAYLVRRGVAKDTGSRYV